MLKSGHIAKSPVHNDNASGVCPGSAPGLSLLDRRRDVPVGPPLDDQNPGVAGLALAGAYAARQFAGVAQRGKLAGSPASPVFRGIEEFVRVEPRCEREPLRPPTFSSAKVPEDHSFLLPEVRLEPTRLIGPMQGSRRVAHAPIESFRLSHQAAAVPGIVEEKDPLWQSLAASQEQDPSLFEQSTASDRIERARIFRQRLAFTDPQSQSISLEADEPEHRKNVTVEDDSIYDSPLPFREYAPSRPSSLWQSIEALFLSRGFSQIVAACVVVLFVSTLDVPWRRWFVNQIVRVQQPLTAFMDDLGRPIRERSAFFIVDDFTNGLAHWANNGSLALTNNGLVRVKTGLALHEGTMNLESYRLDFEAKIESKAVGWVVRARDTNNLYAFKLIESAGQSRGYDLLRYAVVDGAKQILDNTSRISVPKDLVAGNGFNRISVRVNDDQITTLVNGWGVDFWKDKRFERGGVGLLAEAGESAIVQKMAISGNEDTWGLILYGTLETIQSVRNTFTAPVAVILQPVPGGLPANFLASNQPMRLTSIR